jgi:hypothetical protein
MKKLILVTTIVALVGMNVRTAKAGDCEWATVGKVLTGVAAAAIIVNALDCQPAHCSVTYTYSAPVRPVPVVCAPQPVVYAPRPVVFAPAPVVVYRPPVYVPAHRPVVVARTVAVYGRGHQERHHHW